MTFVQSLLLLTNLIQLSLIRFKLLICIFLTLFLVSCGGGSSDSTPIKPPAIEEPLNPVTEVPTNQILNAFFRDQDSAIGKLSGIVTISAPEVIYSDPAKVESVWVYWVDEQGNKQGDAWLKTASKTVYHLDIPEDTSIPANTNALLLLPVNTIGQATKGTLISFHDFIGNAELSGPGGNEVHTWEYGVDRRKISIQRTEEQGGLCIFDNGLVSIANMNNTKDEAWESNTGNMLPNDVNENAFPPYSFLCDTQPTHSEDIISDEIGVWTYSTLNDAMFYGTVVYDSFVKYLGEPPLEEKIRIRVHYGEQYGQSAYWDGAYANFGDAYPLFYSMVSLDSIAHEVGHGVLNRVSDLNLFDHEISTDARTLHEAFGDISGVMAKYEFTGHTNNWIHGQENGGLTRHLDQIKTENGAIDSFLDYEEAGDNFYLRIGMISYPFYLLSNQWGIEPTYKVYLNSAKVCWSAMTTLTEAAECIKQQAGVAGLPEEDVIEAFKMVKIKLFDQGVLSHFTAEKIKLHTQFIDDSRTTSQVVQWLWDFGDGQTSTEASPEHIFAESGSYPIKLTVTDQSDDQDTFERLIQVTDQYCSINSVGVDKHISQISIGGNDINYNSTAWDYTQMPIELTNPSNTIINIQGDTEVTERSTTWKVWIDLNDNGIYGDEVNELVVNKFVAEGQPYSLNTLLDLSTLPNSSQAKYMRIIGDYAVIGPCSSSIGEALDLRVSW
ncbi:PKD domain-containing protein [Colwellia psychrerythraea]|uniref:Neutral zinc metallopeptidase, M4 family n=1 Tax=Colwellia psychrerythraea (strain 34H / ATCC BAA-681) TaxID=167879 RepID=Q485W4_COLP3|nr:PKD domain-containing protein [Colwellia psychrerythraea]AAZ23991.1 neutral zinc metallopeptidase, M4 family [Colwellia psychrerythraea 34H]